MESIRLELILVGGGGGSMPMVRFRWVVGMLLLAVQVLWYADRISIGMAVAQLRQNGWAEAQLGLLLGAFYVGYAISQIPSALLAMRIGAARLLGVCVALWVAAQILFPFSAQAVTGLYGMLFLRFFCGSLYGALVPCSFSLVSHWTPLSEKSRMSSFVALGREVGLLLTLCSSPLLKTLSWKVLFWGDGALVLLLFPLYAVFVSSSPELSRWISEDEKQLIVQNRAPPVSTRFSDVPWMKTFTTPSIYGIFYTLMAVDAFFLILIGFLPSFFSLQGVDIGLIGFYCIPPFLVMAISSVLVSFVADHLSNRHDWRILTGSFSNMSPLLFFLANIHRAVLSSSSLVPVCRVWGSHCLLCHSRIHWGRKVQPNSL